MLPVSLVKRVFIHILNFTPVDGHGLVVFVGKCYSLWYTVCKGVLCYFNELQRKIFCVYEVLLYIFCHISVLGYESRRVKCYFTLCISNWPYIRMHLFPKVLVVSAFLLVVSSRKMDCFSSIIGNEFFFKHYKIQWPILCLNLSDRSKPNKNKMHTNKKEKKEKKGMFSQVVWQFICFWNLYLFIESGSSSRNCADVFVCVQVTWQSIKGFC